MDGRHPCLTSSEAMMPVEETAECVTETLVGKQMVEMVSLDPRVCAIAYKTGCRLFFPLQEQEVTTWTSYQKRSKHV